MLIEAFFDAKPGRYIEVGAHDGIAFSNTYRLEQAGWEGICIEAHPELAERLASNRPGAAIVLAACVGTQRGSVTFHMEPSGLLSGLAPLDEREIHRRYRRRGDDFSGLTAVEVPTTTLDQVLEVRGLQPADIDVMTIDVEGTEVDVLRGIDLTGEGPRVVVAEANDHRHARELVTYLRDNGDYAYAGRLGVNGFFCRPDDLQALRALRVSYCRPGDDLVRVAKLGRTLPRRSAGIVVRQFMGRVRRWLPTLR